MRGFTLREVYTNLPPSLPPARGESWGKSRKYEKTTDLPAVAGKIGAKLENKAFVGENVSSTALHPTGVEPVTFGFVDSGTISVIPFPRVTYEDTIANLPPKLEKIVAAWPMLSEPIRRAMLAILEAAT